MARRVNTKFLTILTILVVGLGVAALLAKKFLIKESPEKYVAYGQVMMAEKKYPEAVKNFQMACSLDPKNPSLWVAYGDALNQLSPTDLEYLTKAPPRVGERVVRGA
jgi:predicted Zn-dependent protease